MQKSLLVCGVVVMASTVLAVGTSRWTQTTEADFKDGTFDNVVATNLGDLKLSRAMRTLLGQDARVSAVYAFAQTPDGTIYAATGPQGVLLRFRDDKVETAAVLGDNLNLFSLLVDGQGRLLIGTGGAKGSVFRIDNPGDKPREIFSRDGVQYVWALSATPDGLIYAATGPTGRLYEIHPDGSSKMVFESDENNLLSMVSDGKDLIYVGTDPNGLIYRVNRKTGEFFIVFDAAESEISALALDAKGILYAGTGQSTGEEPAEPAEPRSEKTGRPEQESSSPAPIPSEPPKVPEPPKLPLPGPGEPQPIPRDRPGASIKPLKLLADVSEPDQVPVEPDPSEPAAPMGSAVGRQPQTPVAVHKAGAPAPGGNAIYRIDSEGFVTEIFRQNALVLSLVERDGALLVGTGGEGLIYQIKPSAEETSVVARVDPKGVLSLLPTRDGKIYVGMANDGQVAVMSSGFATKGSYTSPVLDARQISRFGRIHLRGNLPSETKLLVSTRSGNVAETNDPGWSNWSADAAATEYFQIKSPPARFFQYRLTLESPGGKQTPVVDEISVAYQMPNLAPEVKSISAGGNGAEPNLGAHPAAGTESTANPVVPVEWEASDPNDDALRYALYFRRTGNDSGPWILIKDKLTESSFDWDTRTVGDGRYELRLLASDALANPTGEGKTSSRISDPLDVDNTPPVVGDVKAEAGAGTAKLAARVVDRTTTVARLEYSVDSSTDWQTVLPDDKIADSPEETYAFSVSDLVVGPHQITLRATDLHGNQAFVSVNVTVK